MSIPKILPRRIRDPEDRHWFVEYWGLSPTALYLSVPSSSPVLDSPLVALAVAEDRPIDFAVITDGQADDVIQLLSQSAVAHKPPLRIHVVQ